MVKTRSLLFSALSLVSLAAAPLYSEQAATLSPLTLLEQTSQAFTSIAEQAMPATVYIKSEIQQQQQEGLSFDPFQDDFFRHFFGGGGPFPFHQQQPQQNPPQPQLAGGSGFLITADGYLVTNNHVIKDATHITVILNDGREYEATVKGSDPRTDLAVLKIEDKNLPFLTFGDSDQLKIGELAIAIGNPFGIGATLTMGVISAKGRQDLGIAAYEDFIQTDAAINPGNSGGPLLNIRGEVIGVNTAIYTRSGGYMGIGLSIPSQMAQNVIDQILDHGTVQRGYLGIRLQPVDKDLAEALGLESQEGALVSDVLKDSAASKAGLQAGDVVLQCNGKTVKNVSKLRNDIGMMSPGQEIALVIMRDGEKVTLKATLSALDGAEIASAETLQKLGIEIEDLSVEQAERVGYNGVLITQVKNGSSAAAAGLRKGLIITGVAVKGNQQKSVKNVSELEDALKGVAGNKYLILIIRQQNFQRYYTLKLQ
ncbi:MAG: DegQ family serine endoprotease [Verrucomicrobiota bacterium]|nr:DegQ family serine endoprotease [Verrucomicrobiota bacterium]